jgi:hypothetical protein
MQATKVDCPARQFGIGIPPASTYFQKIPSSSTAEHSAVNRRVVGSNPTLGANYNK